MCVLYKYKSEVSVFLTPTGIDLIAAFYGCLYAGCVPITVRPPHPQNIATTLPTVKMIVEVNGVIMSLLTLLYLMLYYCSNFNVCVCVNSGEPLCLCDDYTGDK